MAIGPVQLIVFGFNQPDFHGEIIAELERLRAGGMVRVIDSLGVYEDADVALEEAFAANGPTALGPSGAEQVRHPRAGPRLHERDNQTTNK